MLYTFCNYQKIFMKQTRQIKLGPYILGSGNPVRVQSMCNTDTRDAAATIAQINLLENAGCEINRVAVPDMQAAQTLGAIKKATAAPLVADIHFDYKLALEAVKQGVDKIRINPGNIGGAANVKEVVKACADAGIPIRIGVNAGSLKALKDFAGRPNWPDEKWAGTMAAEALSEANLLEQLNFKNYLVSLKSDNLERTCLAAEKFAAQTDIPQHIGLTEAGSFLAGAVKSSIAMARLLKQGIGATIRVSLTEHPAMQVRAAYEILKALHLRQFGPEIISCPTCGRCRADVAGNVKKLEELIYADKNLLKKAHGKKIAIMGCAVNGPGEARDADFGIAGGEAEGLWFERGVPGPKIPQDLWIKRLIEEIEK
ncbi:MAG: flavodoxin-dependent (E)-4-hydroxy-3-methylbut-2-enyl-diphosphate synthase [Elusimicrobiota bacterium]|jgi:(E)-4-hydroxy-3-methylbut-2-enyl-diphosphate synthase|nr:flavodoxin-dependent (E)-4-hydroxy-3-methylbut-2-enyl-diphosphate synthase [Elusimicrobiota bacterium]